MGQFVLKCSKCSKPKPQANCDTALLERAGWQWRLMLDGSLTPHSWDLRCPTCKPKDPPPPPKENRKAA